MSKTLKELGEDYLEEVSIMDEKIAVYRERLRRAIKEHNSDEIYIVQTLLKLFYNQKNEMASNARTLLHYYS